MKFATHVKCRSERFGSVIFDTLDEKVYVTSEVGKDILELLREGLDLPAIVANLQERYEGPQDQIQSDVTAFIDELRSAKLFASDT